MRTLRKPTHRHTTVPTPNAAHENQDEDRPDISHLQIERTLQVVERHHVSRPPRDRTRMTIDEHREHPDGLCAHDVSIVVIADVRSLVRIDAKPLAGQLEDPRIGFVQTHLRR